MKIEIRLEKDLAQPTVVICTPSVTPEVEALCALLEKWAPTPTLIPGEREGRVALLRPGEILRIFGADQKVYACAGGADYRVKLRLYEAEELLTAEGFIRISHSELVNLNEVKGLDLSWSGTISLELSDGSSAFVSRRYISKIKTLLGI